jgi:hypothetical protein
VPTHGLIEWKIYSARSQELLHPLVRSDVSKNRAERFIGIRDEK